MINQLSGKQRSENSKGIWWFSQPGGKKTLGVIIRISMVEHEQTLTDYWFHSVCLVGGVNHFGRSLNMFRPTRTLLHTYNHHDHHHDHHHHHLVITNSVNSCGTG